jgi:hypothetical protein
MSSITHHCGPYRLTVWGSGTSVELRKGDYSLFWQGDEAADVADVFNEGGEEALDRLWDDYSDIATYDGIEED